MKKSSREKLINHLQKTANCNTETELAKYLGVNKQKVSYMKSEKGGLDYDLLLEKFGHETLKFLSVEYGINQEIEREDRQEKAGKLLAEAIHLLSQEGKEEGLKLVDEDSTSCNAKTTSIPLYQHPVAAGPATDSTCPVEEYLDLPKHMIAHPAETYAVKALGDSMIGAGIEEGDILIVDTVLEAQDKNVVIASVNGEQTVKKLYITNDHVSLMPSNGHYDPIEITADMDFRVQGVVTWVIRETT